MWSTLAKSDILRPKREFAAFDGRSSAVARGIAALRFVYGAVRGRVTGFIDSSALRRLIASYVMLPGGVARPFIRPMFWTATDLASTCGVAFKREPATATPLQLPLATRVSDRDLVDSLLASASIPGAFDPVAISGSTGLFVDGGVLDNLPLDLARAAGATQIDTVYLIRRVQGSTQFRNAAAIVEEAYGIMRQRIVDDAILLALLQSDPAVRASLRAAFAVSPLREQVPARLRSLFDAAEDQATIRVLIPSQPLAGTGFDARDQSIIDSNVELGFDDARSTGFKPIAQLFDGCA